MPRTEFHRTYQFSSFPPSGRPKTVECEFLLHKWTFSAPQIFGGPVLYGVPPLTSNTAKTSVGEDLVKIRPAVAEQLRQKKRKTQNAY